MNHRYDFIYLFDCADANPNGDPDAGNLPRIDIETGQGLVTDVCLKRKIRNYIQITRTEDTHQIFVRERIPLNPLIKQACEAENVPTYEKGNGWDTKKAKTRGLAEIRTLQNWLCSRYFDIRTFGAVMSTGPNAGQVRGPVQIAFSRSIDPVVASEHAITRMTDVDKEEGEMGRKFTVPYALYRTHGTVNPFLAAQTGFTEDGDDSDLETLFRSLEHAFDFDASAARPAGSMAARCLIVFQHNSQQGNAPSHTLFDAVSVRRKDGVEAPRSFSDYEITIDKSAIPEGVTLTRRI
jgi:CRISPR-associated protein Csd2